MIVLKDFIARENLMKYKTGDDFPRESVTSYRIAELVAKGYLQGEDDATLNISSDAEIEQPAEVPAEKSAEKPAAKKTTAKKRTKKG